jgi:hypothetical protein
MSFGDKKKLLDNFNACICKLSQYDDLIKEIDNLSMNYLKIIKKCPFSGLILINKNEIISDIISKLSQTNLNVIDYYNQYMISGNNKLISNFNALLRKGIETDIGINMFNYDVSLPENFLSYIQIPTVQINIIDSKEMINLKRYQSGVIENFDYYQPELQCYVNVTKIRKSFLLQQKSKDNKSLWDHIWHSLRINHYLQKQYLEFSDTKTFDNFLFLRNFGTYTKEILIDKAIEEEFYIVNEKINLGEFVSLSSLAKTNGGLLFIPEIANTDMGFFILKSWGKSILTIMDILSRINRGFNYLSLKDFYGSFNGRRLKMGIVYSYCCYDEEGKFIFGPDIFKILLLLDKIPTIDEKKITFDMIDNIYSNDGYIPPELIKAMNGDGLTYKTNSWLFGALLYHILLGESPKSYYLQLKEWNKIFNSDCSIQQLLENESFNVLDSNFYYNPFINITPIVQDKQYFVKVLEQKSFAAIIKTNKKNNQKNYDMWTFVDLINSCLSIDPSKRASISALVNFDLFQIDPLLFA